MRHRPSKSAILKILAILVPLLGLGVVLLPLPTLWQSRPGEIVFKSEQPAPFRPAPIKPATPPGWLEEKFAELKKWEHYPWKSDEFGDHYFKLLKSEDPQDQARIEELQRRARAFYETLLLRYPELAVPLKTLPDEHNGFLRWLEFSEAQNAKPDFNLPEPLKDYLQSKAAWDATAAQAFLDTERAVVDEIRAIGLMPDRSNNGIAVDRWCFVDARLAKTGAEALMLEARLAAGKGDTASALESIRAAKGLCDHFTRVESPTLLGATVQILIQLQLENFVFTEILPALPAGQIDPVAWENALRPTVHPPAEFARLMQGEWSAGVRHFLLPILLNADDPKRVPDPGALLDAHAGPMIEVVRSHQMAKITDLPTLSMPPEPDLSHLAKTSREAIGYFSVGARAWRQGWDRAQSASGRTQAAFALLKGLPLPKDPIYGRDYGWDPATRELSMPAGHEFDEMKIKPLVLPTP